MSDTPQTPQTYRDAIQSLQQQSEVIYEKCGSLRDYADLDEKESWNNLRSLFQKVYAEFSKLDNSISDNRASMPLKGNY